MTLSRRPISLENDQSSCYRFLKSGFESFDPNIFELDKKYVFVDHGKHVVCDSFMLSLFMMLLEIIMREENMVIEICMVLKHLSIC